VELQETLSVFALNMRGCFVTLGMLIIGVGLAASQTYKINVKFLSMILGAKFLAAPLTIMIFIEMDRHFLHLFNTDIYEAMLLISFAPPAVNTAIFATMHNAYPEEVSTGVLIGTLLALLYIPMAVSLFIN
jgi:predicted permease